MADALGVSEQGVDQGSEGTSLDYLGIRSPTAFRGQPALPTGGPVAPGTAAPPATGAGTAPRGPTGLQPTTSGDLASTTFADLAGASGSGAPGPGEAAAVGQGDFPEFSAQAGAFGLSGNPFGLTGTIGQPGGPQAALTIGPGTISPSLRTGNPTVDSVINTAAKEGFTLAGVPSQVTAGLLSALTNAPQLVGLVGSMLSVLGAPVTMLSLAHSLASLSPTSVASLQSALNNPEAKLTPEQALAIVEGGARGPTVGGPQPIGQLAIDNPVTNLGASPNLNTPEAQAQNLSATPAFAALANAIFGSGRTDTGPTGPGPGLGEGTPGIGEAGPAGPGAGVGIGEGPGAASASSTGTAGAGVSDF